jgi:hypothetical protein
VQCPVEYITCCTDFFLIHNHCFRKFPQYFNFRLSYLKKNDELNLFFLDLSEVQGNLELLTALNDLGIVIPPGK